MAETYKKSRLAQRWLLAALVFVLLWFTGAVGFVFRPILLLVLPYVSSDYSISYQGRAEVMDPEWGVALDVSEPRLRELTHGRFGWKAYLIPPGLVPRKYVFSGEVRVGSVKVPFVLHIVPDIPAPVLIVRLQSDLVNEALNYKGSFTSGKGEVKIPLLGKRTYTYSIDFDTVSLTSKLTEVELRNPITNRCISGYAKGKIQFDLKGLISGQAKDCRMEVQCDLKFQDGLAVACKIKIPKLDGDIGNWPPDWEDPIYEDLRKELENYFAASWDKLEPMYRTLSHYGIPPDLELAMEVLKSEK